MIQETPETCTGVEKLPFFFLGPVSYQLCVGVAICLAKHVFSIAVRFFFQAFAGNSWSAQRCGEAEGGDILPALHFWWELPDAPVNWLYNSITVEQSAPMSFFMGIGFNGGYFGIQEHNSSADRYVLFSIWDGAEVVEVLDVGRGVHSLPFGRVLVIRCNYM